MSFENFGYTLLIVIATFLYGLNVNLVGHYLKGVNPVHIATVSLAAMTIPTGYILWHQGFMNLNFNSNVVQYSIWASVVLGIAGSAIATALFYILVKKAGMLFASLVTYGIPFIALFWGFIDGEKITWVKWLCLGIILFGVYLANFQDKKKATPIDFSFYFFFLYFSRPIFFFFCFKLFFYCRCALIGCYLNISFCIFSCIFT